jgi:hypothetical protein
MNQIYHLFNKSKRKIFSYMYESGGSILIYEGEFVIKKKSF